jgi:hypothetical protein
MLVARLEVDLRIYLYDHNQLNNRQIYDFCRTGHFGPELTRHNAV